MATLHEERHEERLVSDGLKAEVKTVSWRAFSRPPEMTVWVKCSLGRGEWTLPMEVLPTLEVLEPTEGDEAEPSSYIKRAAREAACSYVAKNHSGLKEVFRSS